MQEMGLGVKNLECAGPCRPQKAFSITLSESGSH